MWSNMNKYCPIDLRVEENWFQVKCMEVSGTNKDVIKGGDPVAMLAIKRAALLCFATQWKHLHCSSLLGTAVLCCWSLATSEVCRTEMNVTASPCFPLLWFCLSLPFCTGESNEGGTQASLFLNTAAALLSPHFPLWDEAGDSPKLRIWEQQARATPPYLPTHPHTPDWPQYRLQTENKSRTISVHLPKKYLIADIS